MTIVKVPVPKPPKSAFNPGRPVSALLKNQILHLQEAEFRLPAKMQTNIYVNAIKTEGEASDYIRRVTMALHTAHGVEPQGMSRKSRVAVLRPRRSVPGPDLAAMADDRPQKKKSKKKAAPKKKSKK